MLVMVKYPSSDLNAGEAAVWFLDSNEAIDRMQAVPGNAERKRHRRKYAEGELEPERVFYFRGAAGKMNLRAHNLSTFLQLAEGVDDDTWLFHLARRLFEMAFIGSERQRAGRRGQARGRRPIAFCNRNAPRDQQGNRGEVHGSGIGTSLSGFRPNAQWPAGLRPLLEIRVRMVDARLLLGPVTDRLKNFRQ